MFDIIVFLVGRSINASLKCYTSMYSGPSILVLPIISWFVYKKQALYSALTTSYGGSHKLIVLWYGGCDEVGETWGDVCDSERFVMSALRSRFEYRRDPLFGTPSSHYQDKTNQNKFRAYFGTTGL